MTKNRTEIRVTSIPSNSLTQTSNGAATAFGEVAMKSRPCLFTMGFEAASERITGKLPHLLAVALLAADARITAKKFADVAAVLEMLVKADVDKLTTPSFKPALVMPELYPWD